MELNTVYSGKDLNEYLKKNDIYLIKLTNIEEIHNGFIYKDGWNILEEKFNSTGKCNKGGLYVCEEKYILYWKTILNTVRYVRSVFIPDDALIYVENNKYKCDKLYLGSRIDIKDFYFKSTKIKFYMFNPFLIQYYKNQTKEISIAIVKQYGIILEFIRKQSEEICVEAVKQNGFALEFVKEQTHIICLEAVKQNGNVLKYVIKQTYDICLEAIKQNAYSIEYLNYFDIDIENKKELYLEAVKRNGLVVKYVKIPTFEIYLEAVKQNGFALEYIFEQTNEICLEAVKQDGLAVVFVNNQTNKICLEAIKQNSGALKYVIFKTNEMYNESQIQKKIKYDIFETVHKKYKIDMYLAKKKY